MWSSFYQEIVMVIKNLIDSEIVLAKKEAESQEEEENDIDEKSKQKLKNLVPILKNYESQFKDTKTIFHENWFNFMNFIFKEFIKTKAELL